MLFEITCIVKNRSDSLTLNSIGIKDNSHNLYRIHILKKIVAFIILITIFQVICYYNSIIHICSKMLIKYEYI